MQARAKRPRRKEHAIFYISAPAIVRGVGVAFTFLLMIPVVSSDWSGVLRFTPDYTSLRDDSLFHVPKEVLSVPEKSFQQNLELRWQRGGFNTTATLRNRVFEGAKPDHGAFFNELYYDKEISGQELTLGKKIMSWGVGFGFRPLDVIQQEDRRALYKNTLEGVELLAWEKFFAQSALTVVWVNPGAGEEAASKEDESLTLKYYQLLGETDMHIIARYSERNGPQAGIGFTRVPSESLEWHASFIWRHRYRKLINRLTLNNQGALSSAGDPFLTRHFDDGIQALIGAGWSHASGWGVLAEMWFDEIAYSDREWRTLILLTEAQSTLLAEPGIPTEGILGNIAFNRQAFRQVNLRRLNTLVRFSRQGQDLEPSFEVLYTPEDRGWVATAQTAYTRNRHRFEAGLREFGGAHNAAYRLLPQDRQLFLSWQWSFQ